MQTKLIEVGVLTLPPTELISEGSWGSRSIGKHPSKMTLYQHKPMTGEGASSYQIEWDVPALETCEHIGLTFDGKRRLEDYDGICGYLPAAAVKLIRQCGFVVPHEFARRGAA